MTRVLKASHLNTDDLWGKHGPDIFRCTLFQKQFHFILHCLHFDDKNDRPEQQTCINFDGCVSNYKNNYTISQYETIYEQLWGFKGPCAFGQFIKSKPQKYVLCKKIWKFTVESNLQHHIIQTTDL